MRILQMVNGDWVWGPERASNAHRALAGMRPPKRPAWAVRLPGERSAVCRYLQPVSLSTDKALDKELVCTTPRDSAAFASLYSSHYDRVYGRLNSYLSSRIATSRTNLTSEHSGIIGDLWANSVWINDDAADLTHSALIRAWAKLPHFDAERGALAPWVLSVAHNLATDELRKNRKAVSLDAVQEAQQAELKEQATTRDKNDDRAFNFESTEEASMWDNPEWVLVHNDDLRRLRLALATVTPERRLLLYRRLVEDWTLEDLAQEMGTSIETVRRGVAKTLQTVRTAMDAPDEAIAVCA